ncbi:DNA polymerase III subunit delta [Nitrococcus mobilis]|uniref:DNA polymerase III subunit delta n=1 Tax=Nitrococcus mobilis Nb-231 TaxID=314278 RepID=A4BQN8_9GAMM|nr:DNA polymerase III subunit delta [Nitrococcus mobilis]EAR21888.1 DNA polymerase III subunit delta [Nitrococcus mobilis Nb-231]
MAKIRIDELERHLSGRLAPVWLVAGEEPLLIDEAGAGIRAAARTAGYSERQVLHAETDGFDWRQLGAAAGNLSLFSERRLIELRLPGGKPGAGGAQALQAYCRAPPADTLLLVASARLDARQRRGAWVEALSRAGVMLYIWPVGRRDLPRWIMQRLHSRGLIADRMVVELLAERAEGNLLAAAQEVEKLYLLLGAGQVDLAAARRAVVDSARYDVFDLSEAVLGGGCTRVARICRGLQEEGTEPTLVLWALARELRVLATLSALAGDARRINELFRQHRIPKHRQPRLCQLAAGTTADAWEGLLARAAGVDRVIKGAAPGRPWDELLQLSFELTALAAAI